MGEVERYWQQSSIGLLTSGRLTINRSWGAPIPRSTTGCPPSSYASRKSGITSAPAFSPSR